MKADIFIKTCVHDAGYLRYCLYSLDKFTSGFRRTIVVHGEHPRGYLHQQVVKLNAIEYTLADYIMFIDSDCVFTHPVTPKSFFRDSKPYWIVSPFSADMLASNGYRAERQCMSEFFGKEPPYEFMRRQPFFVPRWLLVELHRYCEENHGCSIEDYVMNKGVFTEYNILGFFAWLFYREEFCWLNTMYDVLPDINVRQFWSHDPVHHNIDEIDHLLGHPRCMPEHHHSMSYPYLMEKFFPILHGI